MTEPTTKPTTWIASALALAIPFVAATLHGDAGHTTGASERSAKAARAGADGSARGAKTASGQDDAQQGACEDASGSARLLGAHVLCDRCEPGATRVELLFSGVVDAEAIAEAVSTEPSVRLQAVTSRCVRRVVLGGDFAPQRDYRLELPAELLADASAEAQRSLSISTAGGNPEVKMPMGGVVLGPGRELPMTLSSVREARLRLIDLRARELPTAASVVGWHRAGSDPLSSLPEGMKRRVHTRAVTPEEANEEGIITVDPFEIAGGGPVLAVLDAPGAAPAVGLVQRGEHSVLMKLGEAGGLAWVTDVRAGEPVRGARVSIYEGERVRFRGRTDARGLLRLPPESRLRTDQNAGRPWDRTPLRAVAQIGREVAYATEDFSTGLESWQFGLPYSYYGGEKAIRGMVTAERGIYRPGETVHLLGVMRRLRRDGSLRPPRGEVGVEVIDPDGTRIMEKDVRLTRFGTFRHAVEVPKTSRLGRYQVRATKDDVTLSHRFEVGEYRANTFEVKLPPAGRAETQDGDVVLPIRADYLYGAPVGGGQVRWEASWRPQRLQVPGAEKYSFHDSRRSRGMRWLTSGNLELDDDGQGRIVLPERALPEQGDAQALDLVVEATVTDEADDAVTARTVQSMMATDALVGIASDRWVVHADDGWGVEVIAVEPDGRPVPGTAVELRLHRRHWRTTAERGAGGVRYQGHWEDTLVATRNVEIGERPEDVRFDLPGGGSYRVEAVDERGAVAAVARIWAYGKGGSTPVHNHPRMELVTDKERYEPGDEARIFAQTPYERSLALVTVERNGVLEARIERLEGTETPVEVRVAGEHVPNVFVGVAAMPVGLGEASPASGIPLRAGYAELEVSPDERRLQVELEPARKDYRPGDEATVNVKVRDHRGRPVRAEVTLWAADEGVLQLTGYRTPDPFAPVYAEHLHAVSTSTTLTRWTQFDPDSWYEGGGDGAPAADKSAMRSRFLSTAFFSKGVVTDRRGRARVKVELPDNLTRWRVMAAVAGRRARFGKGESAFTVSKPLQVMPSLPRFLTEGDLVDAGLVVHNHTGRAGEAEVRIEVEGAELAGEAVQTVKLGDGGQKAVRFPLLARQVGEVKVRARVRMAGEADAFERSLPVHTATAWSSKQLFDGRIGDEQAVRVPMPSSVQAGQAELLVTVSPSVFASMEGGLDALVEYPHGCVEQTTSRLIPMVLLEDLMKDLGNDRLSSGDHRAKMNDAIAHVLKHQNGDGGFGLWPRSSSEGFLTAYALWGLLTAEEHGYSVPEGALTRAKSYLQRNARHGDDMHGQFSDEETAPFAAYVLAYANRDDDGLGRTLAARHADLSRFSVGLLADAMTRRRQRDATDPLFGAIAEARSDARGGKIVREAGERGGVLHHGRDLRATSSAVQALVQAGRLEDAESLVAGILAERNGSGTWGHTYNNLWALYALSTYAEAADRGRATVPVELSIGGWKETLRITPSAKARQIAIPASRLPAGGRSATLRLQGGTDDDGVRASVRLRYAVRPEAQRPEDHGFRVERELLDAETGAPVEHPKVGQLLRVRLTVHADGSQRQVALVDRLPAGLEPIDTGLATSQRRVRASGSSWRWSWREIHDERVSFFANHLPSGRSVAEYLARASRSGEFVRPALSAEAMYDPSRWGRGEVEHVVVRR